jgi:hypothetical protein
MPYIKKEKREEYLPQIKELAKLITKTGHQEGYQTFVGDLNYTITSLIHLVYRENEDGSQGRVLTYSDYNEIIGILECAKLELYRRYAAPYEDTKILENGDVPDNE